MLLGEVRNRLYQTRERSRHLLAHGYSDIPEEETFTNVEEVCIPRFVKISKISIVFNTVLFSLVFVNAVELSSTFYTI